MDMVSFLVLTFQPVCQIFPVSVLWASAVESFSMIVSRFSQQNSNLGTWTFFNLTNQETGLCTIILLDYNILSWVFMTVSLQNMNNTQVTLKKCFSTPMRTCKNFRKPRRIHSSPPYLTCTCTTQSGRSQLPSPQILNKNFQLALLLACVGFKTPE